MNLTSYIVNLKKCNFTRNFKLKKTCDLRHKFRMEFIIGKFKFVESLAQWIFVHLREMMNFVKICKTPTSMHRVIYKITNCKLVATFTFRQISLSNFLSISAVFVPEKC